MEENMKQCKSCCREITDEQAKEYNGYCKKCYEESEMKNIIEIGKLREEGKILENKEKAHKEGKKNKKFLYLGIIFVVICIFIIFDNINFKKDILRAKTYYSNQEYNDAQDILDKYPLHFNNRIYKKIKKSEVLTVFYETAKNKKHPDENALKYLIWGYEMCLRDIESSDELTSEVGTEISSVYKTKLYYTYDINDDTLKELVELDNEALEQRISTIVEEIKKANTCEKSNVKVTAYKKYGSELIVTLRNDNGCTWNIKSYSEVRVYFTDSSYEDVYLGTNVNLKSNQTYTFSDCYLGSNNKNKTIRTVTFID